MSRHSMPASARARRMAIAPMSIPVRSPKRPNGCSPTPTIVTSTVSPPRGGSRRRTLIDRAEGERHEFVAIVVGAERHEHELHGHADPQAVRRGETRLDLHLVGELHVADAVRHESATCGSGVWRRGGWELLGRPRPEPAAPRQQVLRHLRRRAARARVLSREGDDPARGTPAPYEPGLLGGPREAASRHGDPSHYPYSGRSASERRRLLGFLLTGGRRPEENMDILSKNVNSIASLLRFRRGARGRSPAEPSDRTV